MKTTECATDGCELPVIVEDDAEEGVECTECAGVSRGTTYAQQQAKSYRADAARRNLINYGRCKR